jgi:hypothetical protein
MQRSGHLRSLTGELDTLTKNSNTLDHCPLTIRQSKSTSAASVITSFDSSKIADECNLARSQLVIRQETLRLCNEVRQSFFLEASANETAGSVPESQLNRGLERSDWFHWIKRLATEGPANSIKFHCQVNSRKSSGVTGRKVLLGRARRV